MRFNNKSLIAAIILAGAAGTIIPNAYASPSPDSANIGNGSGMTGTMGGGDPGMARADGSHSGMGGMMGGGGKSGMGGMMGGGGKSGMMAMMSACTNMMNAKTNMMNAQMNMMNQKNIAQHGSARGGMASDTGSSASSK